VRYTQIQGVGAVRLARPRPSLDTPGGQSAEERNANGSSTGRAASVVAGAGAMRWATGLTVADSWWWANTDPNSAATAVVAAAPVSR
jgi:hypothetical protein